MSATAIVMMLLFMAAIWGGLLVSYIMLSRADKSGSAELRTQTTDPDRS
ncbi:MAG: methionine/alanine import family NSS transporter small subunit [Leptotrichiaceae bacterium]